MKHVEKACASANAAPGMPVQQLNRPHVHPPDR